jgi:uncharacterized membrane protein YkoI
MPAKLMKNIRSKLIPVVLALAVPFAALSLASAKDEKSETKVVGSIRPQGKVKSADLPALAKISFQTALQAALVAAPGSVIKGELEIEHGSLMYSFEIVGADHKVKEVEIDAGDGKVLDIDED